MNTTLKLVIEPFRKNIHTFHKNFRSVIIDIKLRDLAWNLNGTYIITKNTCK